MSTTTPKKSDKAGGAAGSASIQVAVRLRPMNDKEKEHGTLPVVTASTGDRTVTVIKGQKQLRSQFQFDRVFTSFSTQEEVFDQLMTPVIGDVLRGFESTVFAYGQTGTGKTHTMEGDLSSAERHGVIPRSSQAIFDALNTPKYSEYAITCSYLEIYNEELCDLLADEKPNGTENKRSSQGATKLEIMGGKNGTIVRGLSETKVDTAEDVLALMSKAQQQRKIGETKMNKASSRSHSIFTMTVKSTANVGDGGKIEFSGKLHLVDLAGSESAKTAGLDKASGAEATRERERMNINRSLLTLGRVISMLKEQSESKKPNNVRIPYRDSKLTRILQEALGGRCKTVIIATLSPSVTAVEESISTLNYAQSANGIINKPVSTSYMTVSPTKTLNRPASGGDLEDAAYSVEHWHEMEIRLQYMEAQVDEAQAALARKHILQQEFLERAEKAEADCLGMKEKHEEAMTEIDSLKGALAAEEARRSSVESQLHEAKTEIDSLKDKLAAEEARRISVESQLHKANLTINSLRDDLSAETARRKSLEVQLKDTRVSLKKTSAILAATQKTEANLTGEAKALLGTLKESLQEGNDLHKLIVEQRTAEIQRRKATRDFNAASFAVLQETVSSLDDLSNKTDRYRDIIVQAAGDAQQQDLASLAAVDDLLEGMTRNVQELTAAMKAQIIEEEGIVPVLHSTKLSVESALDGLLKDVSDRENVLLSSCGSAREQLVAHAAHLSELSAAHSTVSEESISSLEKSLSETRDRVASIVTAATKALATAQGDRAERMAAHGSLVKEWTESSLDAAVKVEKDARNQSESLGQAINFFSEEMSHHDIVDSALAGQRSFLGDKGNEHLGVVEKQRAALSEQAELLEVTQKRQQQLREEVVQKIMSGVQDLVHMQIGKVLANEEQSQMQALSQTNSGLMGINDALQLSAKEIKDTVGQTNTTLQEQADNIRKNDNEANKAMEETNQTLEGIVQSCGEHQQSISTYAEKANEDMAQITDLDKGAIETLGTMISDGEDCSAYISGTVRKEATDDILRLTQSGIDVVSYSVGTVIPKSNAAVNALEEPRKDFIDKTKDATVSLGANLSSGCEKIELLAQGQCDTATDLCNKTETKQEMFKNKLATSRRTEIESRKHTFTDHAVHHGSDTQSMLSICTSKTADTRHHIAEFTSSVIHADEEVGPAPQKNVWVYSEKFSETPSENIILQGIDLDVVGEVPHMPQDEVDRESCDNDLPSAKSIESNSSVSSEASHEVDPIFTGGGVSAKAGASCGSELNVSSEEMPGLVSPPRS